MHSACMMPTCMRMDQTCHEVCMHAYRHSHMVYMHHTLACIACSVVYMCLHTLSWPTPPLSAVETPHLSDLHAAWCAAALCYKMQTRAVHSILLDTVECATVVFIPCPWPPCQRLQPAEGWHRHAEGFAVHVRMRMASTTCLNACGHLTERMHSLIQLVPWMHMA